VYAAAQWQDTICLAGGSCEVPKSEPDLIGTSAPVVPVGQPNVTLPPSLEMPLAADFLPLQGAAEKKMKKNNQCTYVLYLARIELLYTYDDVIFLSRF
jgi:hypothetical protein